MALLTYLAATGQLHSRDSLATLLWPEYDQSRARADLRCTLSLLNRTLGAGWLRVDRETAGLNPDADFTLRDSAPFDEFQFFQTEGLKDELAGALVRLANYHTSQGAFEPAIAYARRWLAIDPTHEPTHRHLMLLYAQAGRHSAALRQYRECVRVLEEELDLPPSDEITALYQRIRAERARPAEVGVVAPMSFDRLRADSFTHPPAPAFLTEQETAAAVERSVFVARGRELARLDGYLATALTGQGQVVFVTGGPGPGKTALMREFAQRAMNAHPDLLVAGGNCNAYSWIDSWTPSPTGWGKTSEGPCSSTSGGTRCSPSRCCGRCRSGAIWSRMPRDDGSRGRRWTGRGCRPGWKR
jgi:DNA-binding SARP family transcriptional activator